MKIPPHIGWPAFVVSLLLTSMVVAFSALYFSKSDGGAQPIEDYYRKAEQWEGHMSQQNRNVELGWTLALTIAPTADADGKRAVQLQVLDAEGNAVHGLAGTVTTARPQWAASYETQDWQPVPDAEGTYIQNLDLNASGLWDFHIMVERADERFEQTVRKEVRAL